MDNFEIFKQRLPRKDTFYSSLEELGRVLVIKTMILMLKFEMPFKMKNMK